MATKISIFPITGMHCAACAARVEKTLGQQPGVVQASVNLANATARVEYTGESNFSLWQKAVRSIGFDLLWVEEEDRGHTVDLLRSKSLKRARKHTAGALILSVPTVAIGMFFMELPYAPLMLWGLSTPVLFLYGREFFVRSWKLLKKGSANMDTLVALSTGTAYLFSVFNLLFPSVWNSRGIHSHVYFEAAAVIIAFILLGKYLEEKAKGRTSSAIKSLMELRPAEVYLWNEGNPVVLSVDAVKPGDVLLARPGDQIAVDGKVLSGSSYVDESMMTGEPLHARKEPGDIVFAGTINQKGGFRYQAVKTGKGTLLSQIIRAVEDAQNSKAPVQKLTDRIASVFVPVVLGIALLSLGVWYLAEGNEGVPHGILSMVTVLIIACPCALGLATPTAIMTGLGRGASEGILIRNVELFEAARKLDTLVFDKTGTLTEGFPQVREMVWFTEDPKERTTFYHLEKYSEHPLGEALVRFLAETEEAGLIDPESFETIPGRGFRAVQGGSTFFAGNRQWMEEQGVPVSELQQAQWVDWEEKAMTSVFFASREGVLAMSAISDPLRKTAREAVRSLEKMGIKVYLLSGDNPRTAEAIAQEAGILRVRGGMLPDEKSKFIQTLQSAGKKVVMVGDGINDSSALAQADISIAMGRGSDIAMDVAGITLVSTDLGKIPRAIRLSRQIAGTIRQNLFWAFLYNVIGIPLAAGVLYPFTGFLLDPMIAGAAMALSSVSVVSNSLRLRWRK